MSDRSQHPLVPMVKRLHPDNRLLLSLTERHDHHLRLWKGALNELDHATGGPHHHLHAHANAMHANYVVADGNLKVLLTLMCVGLPPRTDRDTTAPV